MATKKEASRPSNAAHRRACDVEEILAPMGEISQEERLHVLDNVLSVPHMAKYEEGRKLEATIAQRKAESANKMCDRLDDAIDQLFTLAKEGKSENTRLKACLAIIHQALGKPREQGPEDYGQTGRDMQRIIDVPADSADAIREAIDKINRAERKG